MRNRNKKVLKEFFLNHRRGFTPLENATDFSLVRDKSLNGVRKRISLMGFTLIEIVTALAILVIGLVSILALFPVGFQASGRAADYTRAAIFAQEKMEEIKMKGFDNAKSETEEDTGNKEGKFTRKVTVADVTDYEGYLKEVIVTVGWKERGKNREKEFKTYVADYTP